MVTVTDLITQLINLFSSNREAQAHVFECAAHLQAAQLVQTCITQFEDEVENKLRSEYNKLQKLKTEVQENINFIQFIHELLIQGQNFRTQQQELDLINELKLMLN